MIKKALIVSTLFLCWNVVSCGYDSSESSKNNNDLRLPEEKVIIANFDTLRYLVLLRNILVEYPNTNFANNTGKEALEKLEAKINEHIDEFQNLHSILLDAPHGHQLKILRYLRTQPIFHRFSLMVGSYASESPLAAKIIHVWAPITLRYGDEVAPASPSPTTISTPSPSAQEES